MVKNAMVERGTNTRPKPKPWTTPVQINGHDPICGEKPVMKYNDGAVRFSPSTTKIRVSTRRTNWPAAIIDAIVPIQRGPITRPVVMVG